MDRSDHLGAYLHTHKRNKKHKKGKNHDKNLLLSVHIPFESSVGYTERSLGDAAEGSTADKNLVTKKYRRDTANRKEGQDLDPSNAIEREPSDQKRSKKKKKDRQIEAEELSPEIETQHKKKNIARVQETETGETHHRHKKKKKKKKRHDHEEGSEVSVKEDASDRFSKEISANRQEQQEENDEVVTIEISHSNKKKERGQENESGGGSRKVRVQKKEKKKVLVEESEDYKTEERPQKINKKKKSNRLEELGQELEEAAGSKTITKRDEVNESGEPTQGKVAKHRKRKMYEEEKSELEEASHSKKKKHAGQDNHILDNSTTDERSHNRKTKKQHNESLPDNHILDNSTTDERSHNRKTKKQHNESLPDNHILDNSTTDERSHNRKTKKQHNESLPDISASNKSHKKKKKKRQDQEYQDDFEVSATVETSHSSNKTIPGQDQENELIETVTEEVSHKKKKKRKEKDHEDACVELEDSSHKKKRKEKDHEDACVELEDSSHKKKKKRKEKDHEDACVELEDSSHKKKKKKQEREVTREVAPSTSAEMHVQDDWHAADNLLPVARTDTTRAASEHEHRKKKKRSKRAVTDKEDPDILLTSGDKPVSCATELSRKCLSNQDKSHSHAEERQQLKRNKNKHKKSKKDKTELSVIQTPGPEGSSAKPAGEAVVVSIQEGKEFCNLLQDLEMKRDDFDSSVHCTECYICQEEMESVEEYRTHLGKHEADNLLREARKDKTRAASEHERRKKRKRAVTYKEDSDILPTSGNKPVSYATEHAADNLLPVARTDTTRAASEHEHRKKKKRSKRAVTDKEDPDILLTSGDKPVSCATELSRKCLSNQDKSHSNAEERQQLKRNKKHKKSNKNKTELSVIQTPVPEGSSAKPAGEAVVVSIQEGKEFCNPVQDSEMKRDDFDSSVCCTVCYICQEEMESVEEYRAHLGKVHSKLVFQCLCCKCLFNSPQTMQGHIEIACTSKREIPRTFRCTICPKMYVSKMGYKNHLRLEHDIGPRRCFQCFRCNKTYTENFSLREHERRCQFGRDKEEIRKIRNAKPFRCDLCQKEFVRNSALNRHIKVAHERHKLYTCICGTTFVYSFLYSKHLKTCSQINQVTSDQPHD